jgi:hypothetical protein
MDTSGRGTSVRGGNPRPAGTQDALEAARTHLAKARVMVSIYSDRCLLADPDGTGTLVPSVYQTNIMSDVSRRTECLSA